MEGWRIEGSWVGADSANGNWARAVALGASPAGVAEAREHLTGAGEPRGSRARTTSTNGNGQGPLGKGQLTWGRAGRGLPSRGGLMQRRAA